MKVRISAFHLLSYWVYFIFCRSSQVSETVVFCRWWSVVSSHTRLSPGYKTASFGQQQQLGSPVTTTRLITSETLALGVLHTSEHKQQTHSTHLFYCQTWCAYGNLTAEQGRFKWNLTDFPNILTTFWPLLEGISPFFLTSLEGNSYHESQITASSA